MAHMTQVPDGYILILSFDEARVLRDLVGSVEVKVTHPVDKHIGSIYEAMKAADVPFDYPGSFGTVFLVETPGAL